MIFVLGDRGSGKTEIKKTLDNESYESTEVNLTLNDVKDYEELKYSKITNYKNRKEQNVRYEVFLIVYDGNDFQSDWVARQYYYYIQNITNRVDPYVLFIKTKVDKENNYENAYVNDITKVKYNAVSLDFTILEREKKMEGIKSVIDNYNYDMFTSGQIV
jgi:chromosomal replication initiation ATPase DnaA